MFYLILPTYFNIPMLIFEQSPKRGVTSGGQERGGSPEDTPMGSPRAERDGDSDEGMESEGEGDVMQDVDQ
jgi:hypothetical protein